MRQTASKLAVTSRDYREGLSTVAGIVAACGSDREQRRNCHDKAGNDRSGFHSGGEYHSNRCGFHGGHTIATKLYGTLGRSSWTHSHWPLGMSSIPDSGPICDGPEGRTEPATASTTSPTLSRSIPNSGCGRAVRSPGDDRASGVGPPHRPTTVDRPATSLS